MVCREVIARSSGRAALLNWAARIGAVTAEALAQRGSSTVVAARARLLAAERAGLLARHRPLAGRPALYTVTRAGLRAIGSQGLDPCRVSASNAAHLIACAGAAAALERAYPDHRIVGERELRRDERAWGGALASAPLGRHPDGSLRLHRPDLALWPWSPPNSPPIAVEVELTVKAPRRLFEICRAWARCRNVAGVLYLVSPQVERPLRKAIADASASERIVAVPLEALAGREGVGATASKTITSGT
jgi:hypothetical protein